MATREGLNYGTESSLKPWHSEDREQWAEGPNQKIAELETEIGTVRSSISEHKTRLEELDERLIGLNLQLQAEQLRGVEQVLKEKIDWYVPLEDILGIPIIGMKMEDFEREIINHDHLEIHAEYDSENILINQKFKLRIDSKYVKLAEIQDLPHQGAEVDIHMLPDSTLRPKCIRYYNKIFPGKQEFHLVLDVEINLINILDDSWEEFLPDGITGRVMHAETTRYDLSTLEIVSAAEIYKADGQLWRYR